MVKIRKLENHLMVFHEHQGPPVSRVLGSCCVY